MSLLPERPDFPDGDEHCIVKKKLLFSLFKMSNVSSHCASSLNLDVPVRFVDGDVTVTCIECGKIALVSSSQGVHVFDGFPRNWSCYFVCAVFTALTNDGGCAGYSETMTDLSVAHTEYEYLFTEFVTFLYSAMERHRAELLPLLSSAIAKANGEVVDGELLDIHVSCDCT